MTELNSEYEQCPAGCEVIMRWMHAVTDGTYVYDWVQCPDVSCAYSKIKSETLLITRKLQQFLDING